MSPSCKDSVIFEGHLDGTGWTSRYWRLSSDALEYYTSDVRHRIGTIALRHITDVVALASGTGREICIYVAQGDALRKYHCRASSALEADAWRMKIAEAAKESRKSIPTPQHCSSRIDLPLPVDSAEVREYVEKHKLREYFDNSLAACAKEQPYDPLLWISEYFQNLSEGAEVSDSAYERNLYKENWRWYIYSAERKIDQDSEAWRDRQETKDAELKDQDSSGTGKKNSIVKDFNGKFTCFLPKIILRAIDDANIKPQAEVMADQIFKKLDAIVVFMDASGFTSLTEKLNKERHGAESLGRFLNEFFAKLIYTVSFFGGDIIKFSGDAMTIMWPADASCDNNRFVAVYRACQCCLHVHKELTDSETPVKGVTFSVHIGVGFGSVTVMQVGGIFNRWEYCIAGEPLKQVAIAEPLAGSGETCLSPDAAALLKEACVKHDIRLEPLIETKHAGFVKLTALQEVSDLTRRPNTIDDRKFDLSMLEKYIPVSEFRVLQQDGHHEDEMRNVTVLFLLISDLDISTVDGAKVAQMLMTCCQRSIYALEGSINKFVVDDKGIFLLAVFGLPPLSHFGDDPVRGVLAGLRILDNLKAENIRGQVGCATGLVWCGVVGNEYRKEYTVLGDVVNLSARLMSSAECGGMYVDLNTANVLKENDFEVDTLSPLSLKGKAEPVPVFRPTGKVFKKSNQKDGKSPAWSTFWTSSTVVRGLKKVVTTQLSKGGGVICITGPAGSGKSQLLDILRLMKQEEHFTLLEGNNMSPTNSHPVPFQCWQLIFTRLGRVIRRDSALVTELTGRPPTLGLTMKTLISAILMSEKSEMENWVPLLSKVMTGVEFGDTVVKAMGTADVEGKKNYLQRICMEILDWYSSRRPTVVILHLKQCSSFFEDRDKRLYPFAEGIAELVAQKKKRWSDSGDNSSEPRKPCLIFVLCCRDNSFGKTFTEKNFNRFKDVAKKYEGLIQMRRFSSEETRKYLGYCFGSTGEKEMALPEQIASYVHDMTRGNAGLIDKVAQGLLEQNIVQVVDGRVRVIPAEPTALEDRLKKLDPPESIVGIAFSQFDRLKPSVQHLIKIASALGHDKATFTIDDILSYKEVMYANDPAVKKTTEKNTKLELDQLVKDEIFAEVDGRQYRFCSRFWRIAAEKLTLQSQRWVKQRSISG